MDFRPGVHGVREAAGAKHSIGTSAGAGGPALEEDVTPDNTTKYASYETDNTTKYAQK